MCITVPDFVKSVKQLWRYADLTFFQHGGPSAILIWTIHNEHLVVFSVVQNLVRIDAVCLIICRFQYFAHWA